MPSLAGALEAPSTEDRVKTAIAFKITRFVSWPTPVDKIKLCVLGEDEFIKTLKTMTGKVSRGREIEVVEQKSPAQYAGQCQMLFLDNTEKSTTQQILNDLRGKPVLTISDDDGFVEKGGIIGLFRDQNKIRIAINLKSSKEAGLAISAPLLDLAKIVQ